MGIQFPNVLQMGIQFPNVLQMGIQFLAGNFRNCEFPNPMERRRLNFANKENNV
jgi:hypothetical protein